MIICCFSFTLLEKVQFDFSGANLSSLFWMSQAIDLSLIWNRRVLRCQPIDAVSLIREYWGWLFLIALFLTVDHKYIIEALACAEILLSRKHCFYWNRFAILFNCHICKGNLAFASISLCCTINNLILTSASHYLHQSMILVVQLVEILIKIRLVKYIKNNR